MGKYIDDVMRKSKDKDKSKISLTDRLNLAKNAVYEAISILDNETQPLGSKGESWNMTFYKNFFSNTSQYDLIKFFQNGEIRYYIDDNKNDISLEKALRLCDELGVPAMEDVTLPFLYKDQDTGEELYADKKCLCIDIKVKRLHQIATNESHSSSDITERDWKTNQAIGDSKSAMVSDVEVAMIKARGYHKVLEEMLTVRADHTKSKAEFYNNLRYTGESDIPDSIYDVENKTVVKLLHFMYIGAGLLTDLIETDVDRGMFKASVDLSNLETNILFSEVLQPENLDKYEEKESIFISNKSKTFIDNMDLFKKVIDIINERESIGNSYVNIVKYQNIVLDDDLLLYITVRCDKYNIEYKDKDRYMRCININGYILNIIIDNTTGIILNIYVLFLCNTENDRYIEYYDIMSEL